MGELEIVGPDEVTEVTVGVNLMIDSGVKEIRMNSADKSNEGGSHDLTTGKLREK